MYIYIGPCLKLYKLWENPRHANERCQYLESKGVESCRLFLQIGWWGRQLNIKARTVWRCIIQTG